MVETFTQNELIMAIYHELSSDKMVGLESQLNTNFEIEDNFDHLQEMKTALDQLKEIKRLQENWSDNSVSCTIYYRKEEIPEIRDYLNKHYRNNHKSLSFLLHSEHGFKQAPYEEITKEQYEELLSKTKVITSISSAEFEGGDECATGACPIR